jgi:hypothetical protein
MVSSYSGFSLLKALARYAEKQNSQTEAANDLLISYPCLYRRGIEPALLS